MSDSLAEEFVDILSWSREFFLAVCEHHDLPASVLQRSVEVTGDGDNQTTGITSRLVSGYVSNHFVSQTFLNGPAKEVPESLVATAESAIGAKIVRERLQRLYMDLSSGDAMFYLLKDAIHLYLSNLDDLEEEDEAQLKNLSEQFSDVLQGVESRCVLRLPIAGVIPADGAVTCGYATLRRLTPSEIGPLRHELANIFDHYPGSWFYAWREHMPEETSVVELNLPTSNEDHERIEDYVSRIVWSMQLHQIRPTGDGHIFRENYPELGSRGRTYYRVEIPDRSFREEVEVPAPYWESIVNLADQLPKDVRDGSSRNVALERYLDACNRIRPADSIVDLTVSMEAIALPLGEGGDGELSLRTALNLAWYLGRDSQERTQLYRQCKEIYSYRSRLVHGSQRSKKQKLASQDDVKRVDELARSVVSRALKKALDEGPPTAENLADLRLGLHQE